MPPKSYTRHAGVPVDPKTATEESSDQLGCRNNFESSPRATRLRYSARDLGTLMKRAEAITTYRCFAATVALLCCANGGNSAQTVPVSVEETPRGTGIRTVTPVFDQIVSFVHPVGFRLVFENVAGSNYIQEHAPQGETTKDWSQLITMTGHKGLAAQSQLTPGAFAQQMAAGIQRSCPDTFAARPLGNLKISGHDGFVALVGCGTVTSGAPRSEVVLLVTAKGTADFFSIQWAERGAPIAQPPLLDEEQWKARFRRLGPIRICGKVPGEGPPFASCMDPQ